MSTSEEQDKLRQAVRVGIVHPNGQGPDSGEKWQHQALEARDQAERLRQMNDLDGALKEANRFVVLALGGAGLVSEWTAVGYALVADLEQQRQNLAAAGKAWEAVANLLRTLRGPDHPEYAVALVRLAQVYLRRRTFPEAEPLYLRALAILQKAGSSEEVNYSVCLNNLGMLYHLRGDDARAEPLLHQVVEVRRQTLGPRHPLYLHCLQDLADFYRSRNDLALAEAWRRQADDVEKNMQTAVVRSQELATDTHG